MNVNRTHTNVVFVALAFFLFGFWIKQTLSS